MRITELVTPVHQFLLTIPPSIPAAGRKLSFLTCEAQTHGHKTQTKPLLSVFNSCGAINSENSKGNEEAYERACFLSRISF